MYWLNKPSAGGEEGGTRQRFPSTRRKNDERYHGQFQIKPEVAFPLESFRPSTMHRVHTHDDQWVSTYKQISITKHFVKSRRIHEKVRNVFKLTMRIPKLTVNTVKLTCEYNKCPGLSQVFHDRTNPEYLSRLCR